jgi:hypothetical protein
MFDQDRDVACITCSSVIAGGPVLVVTHYEDDHSWAFLDGQIFDPNDALVVAMSTVLNMHPELHSIADLTPGWSANRTVVGAPWSKHEDQQEEDY